MGVPVARSQTRTVASLLPETMTGRPSAQRPQPRAPARCDR